MSHGPLDRAVRVVSILLLAELGRSLEAVAPATSATSLADGDALDVAADSGPPIFADGFETGDSDAWIGPFRLVVEKSGTGGGTVFSDPSGIGCGANCVENFNQGTVVTLSAAPDAASTFSGWSGGACAGVGDCVLTMAQPTTVTAAFEPLEFTLDVSVFDAQGLGQLHASSSPGEIDCYQFFGVCSDSFVTGTTVVLTLHVPANEIFDGWLGACSGQGPACTLAMNANLSTTGLTSCNGPCV